MLEELWSIREEVKKRRPLVVNLTNNVVTNFTANVLLAVGASPIMSEGYDEAEELCKIANSVVLNIGTLHPRQVDYFLKAGEYTNKYNKPLILDPVGVGATAYRNETALKLIEKLQITLIRGNYSEIGYLAGAACITKGVDSLDSQINLELIQGLAAKNHALVSATGEADYLTDGFKTYVNKTGHELLQMVTGSGCALTSVIAAFMAVSEEPLLGAFAALTFYGAAAEIAACHVNGPGSFQVGFIDALYNMNLEEFKNISNEKSQIMGT